MEEMTIRKRLIELERATAYQSGARERDLKALRNRCMMILNINCEGHDMSDKRRADLEKTIREIDAGTYKDPLPPLPTDWDERAAEVTRRLRAELRS